MKCSIDGCQNDSYINHDMCSGHLAQIKKYGKITHKRLKSRDGRTSHKLYSTWLSMKDRCRNPNNRAYKNYGGRGIKVCDRWTDWADGFKNFVEDMGDRPKGYSLDRIDVNGDYCPENCRWSDRVTQNLNRRDNLQEPYISTRQRGGRTQYVVRVKDLRFPNGVKVRTKVRTSLSLAMAARDELLAEMRKMGAR